MAQMTDVWKYMAGDSLDHVTATLSTAQKRGYPIAKFRDDWSQLSDTDKTWFKDAVDELPTV